MTLRPPDAPQRMAEAAATVTATFGNVEARRPTPESLAATVAAVEEAWAQRDLSSIENRHWRRSPWVLFSGDLTARKDPRFIEAYGRVAADRLRPRFLGTLLHTWLLYYPENELNTFIPWQRALARVFRTAAHIDSRRARAIGERAERLAAFELNGPAILANDLMTTDNPEELLGSTGLGGELSRSAFLAAAFRQAVSAIALEIASSDNSLALEQLFDHLVHDEAEVRFPSLSHEVATKLLAPFEADPGRAVPKVREALKSRLLGLLGDPRLHPERWSRVGDGPTRVMKAWLAEETLETFIRVLDETADKRWKFRRAFWMAYYEAGHILEAWAAFGPDARAIAHRGEGLSAREFGGLSGGSANHSVLILRIGRLTIAEWSHNGQCWIWSPGDTAAPHLYQYLYKKADLSYTGRTYMGHWINSEWAANDHEKLAKSPLGFWHTNSKRWVWQKRVRDHIHRHTGIFMPDSSFALR